MITNAGKNHILRRNAGIVNSIADTILLGISNTAESANDNRLSHEFMRLDVVSIYPDVDNGTLVFKTVVPAELKGSIYEVGLLSRSSVDVDNYYDKLLTTFDQNEFWSSGSLITNAGRAGGNMLRLTGNSFATVNYDLSYYVGEDIFALAVNSATSTTVTMKIGNNSSNYFSKSISLNSGYQFINFAKSSFSVNGNPTWNEIKYLAFDVSNATVDLDSLRVQKKSIVDTTYVLVSRKVFSSPWEKLAGSERELEYSLKIV